MPCWDVLPLSFSGKILVPAATMGRLSKLFWRREQMQGVSTTAVERIES
ncbi:hypothetical protein [Microcoleus sp. FACHB-672]|nr:hypothetical protein [Microcoleus sp. FACHB-672]MBD2043079.1 hypothetical protein [Microcoleus sp. FACHB-672]MBW4679679.1 hypothetical protein [Microcoleus vaginatus WJT46-NPBG5]